MLFNSTEFLLFLGAFVLLYWLVRQHLAARNVLIIAASWLFYGWWDWRFLGLLVFSSFVDFSVGLAIGNARTVRARRGWLWVSLAVNLGLLGTFKYLGFFLDTFYAMLGRLGVEHPSWTWNVILPVGISFYTFQSLSYTIDLYRRQIEPTRDLLAFLAFVAFFPQLVAGPIARAGQLLPQFQRTLVITKRDLEEGVWLVLWGLFKKVVVADNLAPFVDLAFDQGVDSAPVTLLGTLAFAGQIYGDFSGYSDIARGLARWLGFDLLLNFNLPYTATNVREFWRRWHISLSTWLRDYLYVPLGGNRHGEGRTRLNLLLTMLLGGLWHGAAWNFVLWGALHGCALITQRWWSGRAERTAFRLPRWFAWALTITVVGYGWLLFRAGPAERLVQLHASLLQWSAPVWLSSYALGVATWWLPLAAVQLWQWRRQDLLRPMQTTWTWRAILYGSLAASIGAYWERDARPFLYFQF